MIRNLWLVNSDKCLQKLNLLHMLVLRHTVSIQLSICSGRLSEPFMGNMIQTPTHSCNQDYYMMSLSK
jgi:hypothetical protein